MYLYLGSYKPVTTGRWPQLTLYNPPKSSKPELLAAGLGLQDSFSHKPPRQHKQQPTTGHLAPPAGPKPGTDGS